VICTFIFGMVINAVVGIVLIYLLFKPEKSFKSFEFFCVAGNVISAYPDTLCFIAVGQITRGIIAIGQVNFKQLKYFSILFFFFILSKKKDQYWVILCWIGECRLYFRNRTGRLLVLLYLRSLNCSVWLLQTIAIVHLLYWSWVCLARSWSSWASSIQQI